MELERQQYSSSPTFVRVWHATGDRPKATVEVVLADLLKGGFGEGEHRTEPGQVEPFGKLCLNVSGGTLNSHLHLDK